jgi:hypothetical protein
METKKDTIIGSITSDGVTKLILGERDKSVREKAKAELNRIMPYEEWLVDRGYRSESDIAAYCQVVNYFQRVAKEGEVYKFLVDITDGTNRIKKEYRKL